MSLNDSKIRKLKPSSRPVKLSDSHGLYLLVNPGGSRIWYLKYRFNGKESRVSLGAYPLVSLAEARQQRDGIRKLLAQNINPAQHLDGVVASPVKNHHPALPLERLPELLDRIDDYQQGRELTRLAVMLTLHLFIRSSELRFARWSEIDFRNKIWTIPATREAIEKVRFSGRGAKMLRPRITQRVRGKFPLQPRFDCLFMPALQRRFEVGSVAQPAVTLSPAYAFWLCQNDTFTPEWQFVEV